MVTQCEDRIRLVLQHVGDGGKAEAEIAEQKDALQPHNGDPIGNVRVTVKPRLNVWRAREPSSARAYCPGR